MAALLLPLAACESMPKHTNTLIFGTATRFAFDVSQDPTGSVGVTLGYKRQEAVWMPLLANETSGPATCEGDVCRKFEGSTGNASGPAGSGATDTYSVLATFSGQTAGSAGASQPAVQGQVGIAQFFATGFAARLLASTGGAALVNTQANPAVATTVSPEVHEKNKVEFTKQKAKIERLVAVLTTNDGSVNSNALDALLAKTAASTISDTNKQELRKHTTAAALREFLSDAPFDFVAGRLYESLD
jgi:hypothetical protein